MSRIEQHTVETNGIRMRVAEQGAGPLVVLCQRPGEVNAELLAFLAGLGAGAS